jgi:hypothetical protein
MRRAHIPMRRSSVFLAGVLALCGGLVPLDSATAQPRLGNLLPAPRLLAVSPPGGKAGTVVEVTFTGTDLDVPQALVFSHPDIKAEAVQPPAKVDPKVKPDPKKPEPTPPAVSKFKVTIGAQAPIGFHDVRLVAKHGISNPRIFVVGDQSEALEKEPNNDIEPAQRIEIGTTINGAVSAPTDVDFYVFAGKKGQRVVVSCLGPSIDSRINPELKLLDGTGREIAYDRPAPGTDGLFDITLPADGDYYIRLCQFTYTVGSAEYFYRLTISGAPWIDVVHPMMIEPGKKAQVTIYGRNLPGGAPDPAMTIDGRVLEKLTVTVAAPAGPVSRQRLAYSGLVPPVSAGLDGFEYRLMTPAGASNPVLFTFARAPVVLDNGANETAQTAQQVTVPCEIAGRIEKKRDRDWYKFTAKKDSVYIIEVLSHRLGSPTDMYLIVRNATGKQPSDMTLLDDNPETLSVNRMFTASRDPAPYRFVAPADGEYQLFVASHFADTMADAQHFYQARISPEQPDFRLIAMPPDEYRPDTCIVGQGCNQNYMVFAWRQDGFKGEIALTVEGLPAGVTCNPQMIGPGMKQTMLVVSAAADAPPFTGTLKITGTATINGKQVVREARTATVTWPVQAQQNIPTITRLDRGLMLSVRDKAPFALNAGVDKVTVAHGDKVTIPLKLIRHSLDFKANLQIQPLPVELPPGINFGALNVPAGKDEAQVVFTIPTNLAPGTYNIVVRGFAPISANPKAKPINVLMPSTPVAVTVVPKQVATVSVNNANPMVKLGGQFELVVRVSRQFDYADTFKVKLILPPNTQGISADEVTIPAGQNEAKLILRVPPDANPGNRANLTVQASAVVNGSLTLNHETKISVNVVK